MIVRPKNAALTVHRQGRKMEIMNIAQIEEAVHRGVPFKLKVADGDEYAVPHPDYIFLPPKSAAKRTYVMVHNDQGFASILPLLTITSLTFQIDANT